MALREARAAGTMHYTSAVACPHGHGYTRLTVSRHCAVCDSLHARRRLTDARRPQAAPAWGDPRAILKLFQWATGLTRQTGLPHDVDHIVPLVHPLVCGLHWEGNLQVVPAEDNRAKGNRQWPDMW